MARMHAVQVVLHFSNGRDPIRIAAVEQQSSRKQTSTGDLWMRVITPSDFEGPKPPHLDGHCKRRHKHCKLVVRVLQQNGTGEAAH